MQIILYAVPFFLALIVLELVLEVRRGSRYYRINDAVTSLTTGALSQAANALKLFVPFTLYIWCYQHFSLTQIEHNWLTWVLAFIAYDICYYWNHRCGHEVNVLWAAHVVHHSSEDYNLSTALRQTSTSFLSVFFYLPMAIIGFDPVQAFTVGAINLVYQFWVHTQHIGKLGWFDRVFVSPSNHRVHHAQNQIYLDKNYGGVFVLWDRLFGTFQEERDDLKPVYGIRGALCSWNPLWANIHVYAQLWQDAKHTQNWWYKVSLWFRRTGWRPPDVVDRYPLQKGSLVQFEKFDSVVSVPAKLYVLLQYLIMVVVVVSLMIGLQTMPWHEQVALIAYLVLSGFSVGMVLEGRNSAAVVEIVKHGLLLLACLNYPEQNVMTVMLMSVSAFSIFFLLHQNQFFRVNPN